MSECQKNPKIVARLVGMLLRECGRGFNWDSEHWDSVTYEGGKVIEVEDSDGQHFIIEVRDFDAPRGVR